MGMKINFQYKEGLQEIAAKEVEEGSAMMHLIKYTGWSYFLGQRFCVLHFEACMPSLFSHLESKFQTKHALNL